jgi:polyhydroxybutyrate depolymerase
MKTAFIAFKKTTWSILIVFCLFLSPIALSLKGADWNWHQEFPWVYNNDESDWHYWRAGTDGNFYLWKNKLQKWYQFDSINKQWSASSSSSTSSSQVETGTFNLSLSHGGLTREYILYVPSSYNGSTQVPLLFNFHGFGGTSSAHMTTADMRTLSESQIFLLVYPQGSSMSGYSHWNAAQLGGDNKSSADDVGFVEAMITSISSSYQVNSNRIYACGYSNGGMMSYFLGKSISDKIAAIGSVSGTMLEGNPDPSNPVPMINIHGTSDSVVPYLGNSDYPAISIVLTYWANHNGANLTPVTTSLTSGSTSVEKSVYSDSGGTGWVEHYKVNAGGHDWFNLDLSGSDTNQLIWNFFSQHALDGPL